MSCAASVPGGGVLVFFPSYSLLDACVRRWEAAAAAAPAGVTAGSGGILAKGNGGKSLGWPGKGRGGKGKGSKGGARGDHSQRAALPWSGGPVPAWANMLGRACRKRVFLEARDGGGNAFAATVEAYRAAANAGAAAFAGETAAAAATAAAVASAVGGGGGVAGNGAGNEAGNGAAPEGLDGALLLAVMRGRASEGADFRDAACRAAVVVGVPFPSLSLEARLIMTHRDVLRGRGAGDEW